MGIASKFRKLFLLRPGGGREELAPGLRYILTRQGTIEAKPVDDPAPEPDPDEPGTGDGGDGGDTGGGGEPARPAPVVNTNVMEAFGSRGDVRHLEAMYRNMTNLYSNGVKRGDFEHDPETVQTDREIEVDVPLQLGVAYDSGPKGSEVLSLTLGGRSTSDTLYMTLEGSDNGSVWVLLKSAGIGVSANSTTTVDMTGTARYRYYRWMDVTGKLSPSAVSIRIRKTDYSKFLRRHEQDKIKEKVADPYNIHLFIEGGLPVGEDILTFVAPRGLSLAANMNGSFLYCGVPPARRFAVTMYKNATQLGILYLETDGTFTCTAPVTTFVKGDKLRLVPEEIADYRLVDLSITLAMTRVT